jgi:sulfite reductase (NADPH) hemoprotein beta-component
MSTPPKARPATAPVVFTANRLRDGRVVWLGAGDRWSETVAAARPFLPQDAAAGLALAQAAERRQQVVGVYATEVGLVGGVPVPLKFRERLRAKGPSIAAEPASWAGAARP